MDFMQTALHAIWILLPAYFANAGATLVKYLKKARPIDGGREFRGERLFGEGKTVEGFMLGVVIGSVAGFFQAVFFYDVFFPMDNMIPKISLISMFLLASGAMSGDLAGSFIKRRIGIKRGGPAFPLDQTDFLVGALAFYALGGMVFNPFTEKLTIPVIIAAFLLTPILHLFSNFIAYIIRLKPNPW